MGIAINIFHWMWRTIRIIWNLVLAMGALVVLALFSISVLSMILSIGSSI